MGRTSTGWAYVAVQAGLLLALVVLPGRNDWATTSVVRGVGYAFIAAGCAIALVAALTLGRSLTPTPVPVEHGELQTTGLFRYVRHPIYTGVLAIVVGLTIRSGSWITLAVAALAIAFFNNKAQWEERQLADRYGGYEAYAAKTPRFIPRLGTSSKAH